MKKKKKDKKRNIKNKKDYRKRNSKLILYLKIVLNIKNYKRKNIQDI